MSNVDGHSLFGASEDLKDIYMFDGYMAYKSEIYSKQIPSKTLLMCHNHLHTIENQYICDKYENQFHKRVT